MTTSNEASSRNPLAPFGFAAARARLRRSRSSEMCSITFVAAPRSRARGATNAAHANTRTGS